MNITHRNALEFQKVIVPYLRTAVTNQTCAHALNKALRSGTDAVTLMLIMEEHLGEALEVNAAEHQHIYEMLQAYYGLSDQPVPHELVAAFFITLHAVVAIHHLERVNFIPSEVARTTQDPEKVRREIGTALVTTGYRSLMPHNKDLESLRQYYQITGRVNLLGVSNEAPVIKPSFTLNAILPMVARLERQVPDEHILPTP